MNTQTRALSPHDGPATVGEVIDRHLAETGRKAYWVASEVGMSDGTFRAVRTGKRALKPVEAEKLAEVLGVPVATLIPETNE